ncbi:Ribosomal RNA small subunit methyltransferase J [Buchnera aphidicola (Protaphis terricola)]|uniref:class I SAM-dependent methyltransferase n=1 Tax=Buchnera aphidicola TaxID=9 RepID=UPI003464C555
MNIYLIKKNNNKRIQKIIHQYNLKHDKNSSMALIINNDTLELYDRLHPSQKSIKVDFLSKKNNYRCVNSKKKNEILYKAIGIKKNYFPYIIDATAGFGTEAFLFSFWGCYVVMIERNPIIGALLKDGLERAYNSKKIGNWLKKRLHLIFYDSLDILKKPILKPDIIYLDPMYPNNKKKTLPKKNMQFLRKIIQDNDNYENLLKISRNLVKNRVIVKRPHYAKSLSSKEVSFSISNKKYRFDIYLPYKKK